MRDKLQGHRWFWCRGRLERLAQLPVDRGLGIDPIEADVGFLNDRENASLLQAHELAAQRADREVKVLGESTKIEVLGGVGQEVLKKSPPDPGRDQGLKHGCALPRYRWT